MDDFKIRIQGVVLDKKIKQSIREQLKGISNLSIKISKIDTSKITSAIQQAIKNGYKNAPSGTLPSPKPAPKSKRNSSSSPVSKQITRINEALETKLYDAKIAELEAGFRKLGSSAEEAKARVNDVGEAYTKLKGESDPDKIIAAHKSLNTQIKKTNSELRNAKADATKYVDTFKQAKLSNKIESWLKKNTAATKDARKAMELYLKRLSSDRITPKDYAEISAGYEDINTKMRIQGKLGKSFRNSLSSGMSKIKDLVLASGSLITVFDKFKDSISELKEIDSILTEISKTSDRTTESLKQLGDDSFETASKYGRKASDYLTSVQEMNRSGFYDEKGNAMAEQSLLAQSAGDMTEEVADKWILATNAAYGYEGEAKKINAVLDGTNSITNRNSVNMTDMAEAMSTVGTSAAQAGIEVNELSSIIGTSVATTKKEGSEVGTAWKAILVNLQNISSSKITGTLDKANASMTEMVNGTKQLRDPMEILKDLAKTYNSLDAKDPLKAEITQNIGGKVYHVVQKCTTRMNLIAGNA